MLYCCQRDWRKPGPVAAPLCIWLVFAPVQDTRPAATGLPVNIES